MNRRTNDQILDAVAADFVVDQTDILPRIMDKIGTENCALQNRTIRYAFLSLVITLSILIMSIPEVTSAMRQLFVFLPGVGMVEQSAPVRVLQEVVTQKHDGVTVTVEQLYALPGRTVIRYTVSGIPISAYPKNLPDKDAQWFQNACVEPLFLRLPDGKILTYTGYNAISGTRNVAQYEQTFTLEPVPGNVDAVTLVMPCIDGTERDAIEENWEIPLRLVPVSATIKFLPVHNLPIPTADRSETTTPLVAKEQPSDRDIWVTLDQVVVLPDGYQVYGQLHWADDAPYSAVSLDSYTMTDAQGKQFPALQISPDPSTIPAPGSHFVPLAFQVNGPAVQPGPLTLSLNGLYASLPIQDKNTRFVFDTSSIPDENQRWVLNQGFQVGKYTFRVGSITRLGDGYEFSIESSPEVGCVDLYIEGTNPVCGKCGQSATKVQFNGEVPSGVLTVGIANLDVHLTGTWQVDWLPPENHQR
jgi:hypothetical protein